MTISSDVRAMVVAGFGRDDVIARYGCTPAVLMSYKRAVARPVVRAWGTAGTTEIRATREIASDAASQAVWQQQQARAGILHLVDLKRAGHSPTRTEHRIPPDREQGAFITRPLAAVSFTGSQFE